MKSSAAPNGFPGLTRVCSIKNHFWSLIVNRMETNRFYNEQELPNEEILQMCTGHFPLEEFSHIDIVLDNERPIVTLAIPIAFSLNLLLPLLFSALLSPC